VTPGWAALQGAIEGEVILPGSPGYEDARKPAITRFHDVRPQAVVQCANVDDVAEAIEFALRAGLPFTPRGGGHCFAGRSSTTGIVIDTRPMRSVAVEGDVVKVGAGARLGELYDVLDRHGVTIAGGCGPPVGIAGLVLGGGLGILGRKHGLTCDQLLAAQVVLPDGRVVDCDEDRHEDLFWALRGGGGFGVVTSFALRTVPAPPATSFHLKWPYEQAAGVIAAWQAWSPLGPDELAASLLITAAAELRVHVFGAMTASEPETRRELGRLGVDPASASFTYLPYRETKRHLVENGPGEEAEGHVFMKSEYFRRPLPADAIAALVENFADRPPGESRELDFTPWGGAYNRVPAHATAFPHRSELFLLKQAVVVDPGGGERARQWLERSYATTHPWGTGGVYPNFPEPERDRWDEAYYGANRARLLRLSDDFRLQVPS
jgi:FAD/FMN-containing dehydrogenase